LPILPKPYKPTPQTPFLAQKPTSPSKKNLKKPHFLKFLDFQNPNIASHHLKNPTCRVLFTKLIDPVFL
jgi:hypothetical protein